MRRSVTKVDSIWSTNLILLAITMFLLNFGQGLFRGASTNFFVDTLGLSGSQVLWLAGLREIPGLALIVIAAALMHLPLSHKAAVSLLLMGIGYGLYAIVHSYAGLIVVAVVGSLGFHVWMPMQNSLAMALTTRDRAGRVLGALSSVRAFASIVGMGAIALSSRLLTDVSLRTFYVVGGLLIVIAAALVLKLPAHVGAEPTGQPRMVLKRRYWLYYVLTFFEGSRRQVFSTFATLVLVQDHGFEVWQISIVLLISGTVNLFLSPLLGSSIDRYGERLTLSISYVLLAMCFAGYATIQNAWVLAALMITINLLTLLSMGLTTYANRLAPHEELTPTLSAGVSINHVTSVGMSLVAGGLLQLVGYQGLAWGAATIIVLSVPFALAIQATHPPSPVQPEPAGGS